MRVTVKIDGRPYVVEVGDINARPIIAVVEGERYEVWPEEGETPKSAASTQTGASAPVRPNKRSVGPTPNVVKAPIPGEIVSISVQPGDQVAASDEICTLEAMKMKNTIRSSRVGKIAAVKVAVGQHVAYGDVLVEFQT